MKIVIWHKILQKLALVMTKLLQNCILDDIENDNRKKRKKKKMIVYLFWEPETP